MAVCSSDVSGRATPGLGGARGGRWRSYPLEPVGVRRGAGPGGACWAAIGGEGRFKKPRGPRHWPAVAAAALIGRSAGAAAWFKNTKGAAQAAGPSARGRPGRQHRPLPCPSLRGAEACEHQPPAVRLGSKLGFGVQASSVPGAPRAVPARPEAGQGLRWCPAPAPARTPPRKESVGFVSLELLLPSRWRAGRARGCL